MKKKLTSQFGTLALTILTAFTFSACGGGGGSGGAISIPSVQAECSSAAVSDCSQNNKTVFIGLIQDLAMNCDNTLHGLNASQRQQLFTVSNHATSTRNGIYLTATIDSWLNSTGGQQDTLNEGSYKVCAFVDSNGNGQLDTTEPVGSGQTSTGAGTYILNSWAAAN